MPFQEHPLTSGSVYGFPLHITWHARWTTAPIEEVVAHYRASLGVEPAVAPGEYTFRLPADKPRDVVTVCRPDTPGPHRNGTPIPPEAQTIVVHSTAAGG